jgi:hypothetical protein
VRPDRDRDSARDRDSSDRDRDRDRDRGRDRDGDRNRDAHWGKEGGRSRVWESGGREKGAHPADERRGQSRWGSAEKDQKTGAERAGAPSSAISAAVAAATVYAHANWVKGVRSRGWGLGFR